MMFAAAEAMMVSIAVLPLLKVTSDVVVSVKEGMVDLYQVRSDLVRLG